jgi:BirA family biotin operon repressor/biotin-[acetyl-CoA-carboxylase] ligase
VNEALGRWSRTLELPVPMGWVAETGSTNADLRAAARAGAPHGSALVADRQTAGRGRLGRSWEAGEGNLYLSVLLRLGAPPASLPWLSLGAAAAVAERLGPGFVIKWPNDVLAPDGRKIAGLLAEVEPDGKHLAVVLGIGVNLGASPLPTATHAKEWGISTDRALLAAQIAREVLDLGHQVERDTAPIRERWLLRAHTLGRAVKVGEVTGIATDLDPSGALIVATDAGPRKILAGDVELIAHGGAP